MHILTALRQYLRRGARLGGASALLALLLLALAPHGAGAQALRPNFDHASTSFELIGQHRDLPCEACHANAIFKGTPKVCASCHGVGTQIHAEAKPATHIMST